MSQQQTAKNATRKKHKKPGSYKGTSETGTSGCGPVTSSTREPHSLSSEELIHGSAAINVSATQQTVVTKQSVTNETLVPGNPQPPKRDQLLEEFSHHGSNRQLQGTKGSSDRGQTTNRKGSQQARRSPTVSEVSVSSSVPNKECVSVVEEQRRSSVNMDTVAAAASDATVPAAKSKAELKAERRAVQEAQRAAKAAVKNVDGQVAAAAGKGLATSATTGGNQSTGVVSDVLLAPAAKSKAELKAERRALQEAQRAAKAVNQGEIGCTAAAASGSTFSASSKLHSQMSVISNRTPVSKVSKKEIVTKSDAVAVISVKERRQKQIKLFSHLPKYERNVSVLQAVRDNIHPAITQLGLQYADGVICGSNARCVALIKALQQTIHDFKTPKDKEISHALPELVLDPSINFLEKCRPISVGMKNVNKKLREEIINLDKKLTEDEAKTELVNMLDNFAKDNIEKAHEAIVDLAKDKITSNDIILTYGCSYVVKQILLAAHQKHHFRVIVVDSRPKLEGRSMFNFLENHGIKCSYMLINAISYAMQETTKVFLGAHALLANGYVMSRVGSSQVALVAKAYNKPVLVCCETYKFCELVQTDSFVVNELGNPNDLVQTNDQSNPLEGWKDVSSLNILNLYYDVTPPELITVVVNDVCLVPCTSVPVLLRVRPTKK